MIKSAFMTEKPSPKAVVKPSRKIVEDRLLLTASSREGRFPPIEYALTQIVKNKRLSRALKDA